MNLRTILLVLTVTLLSACSSIDNKPDFSDVTIEECFFPGTDEETAPDWVCTANVDGLITGLGYYPNADNSFNLARQVAQQRARVDLARKLKVFVLGELDDRSVSTGSLSNTTLEEYQSDITTSVTKSALRGTKIYNSVTDENGGLFILVAIDEELAKSRIAQQIQSAYRNDEAAFIKQESTEAISDLRSRHGHL